VCGIRRIMEPNLRKVVDLHQRLTGRVRDYMVEWCDVSLIDRMNQARAEVYEADAALKRLEYGKELWRQKIWTQTDVAMHATGVPDVAEMMDEPMGAPAMVAPPSAIDPAADPEEEEQRGLKFSDLLALEELVSKSYKGEVTVEEWRNGVAS